MNAPQPFTGLSKQLPEYLEAIRQNNNRQWYQEHKDAFKQHVTLPLTALAEAVFPSIKQIDENLSIKCSRPQRDVRFAADKSPYHSNIWFTFRRQGEQWVDAPAFYFDAGVNGCRWGMGFYMAKATTMKLLREVVGQNQQSFLTALKVAEDRGFHLEGEPYKRQPAVPEHTLKEIARLYQIRNIFLFQDTVYTPKIFKRTLAKELSTDFEALSPLYDMFRMAYEHSRIETV